MLPIILLAVLGVGAVVAIAAGRDMGIRFADGCTAVELYRSEKARETLTEFAKNAAYDDPISALDAWLTAVPGDTVECFQLGQNMDPPPLEGVSAPALPSKAIAAVYLLYLGYMVEIFNEVRPTFDPTFSINVWQAIADRFGLSDADVNAVPIDWSGE